MATFQELVIKFRADSKQVMAEMGKIIQKANLIGQGFKGAMNQIASSMGGWPVLIGSTTAALGVATAAVGGFGAASLKAYSDSLDVVHAMEASLKSTGRFSDSLSQSLQANADRLQGITLFGDEEILQATTRIANLTKLTGPALAQAQDGVVALATRLQVDLPTASTIMSKAINGNMGILKRYGIELEGTKEPVQNLALVMREMAPGMEQAMAKTNTLSGSFHQFTKFGQEVLEKVGELIAKFGEYLMKSPQVKAAVDALARSTKDLNDWLGKHKEEILGVLEAFSKFILSVGHLAGALLKLWGVYNDLSSNSGQRITEIKNTKEAFQRLKEAVEGIAGFINNIATAIDKVSNAIGWLRKNTSELGKVKNTIDFIQGFGKFMPKVFTPFGIGVHAASYNGLDYGVGDVPTSMLPVAYNGLDYGVGDVPTSMLQVLAGHADFKNKKHKKTDTLEKVKEENEQFIYDMKRIAEELATPFEKLNIEMVEYEKALRSGYISQEQFNQKLLDTQYSLKLLSNEQVASYDYLKASEEQVIGLQEKFSSLSDLYKTGKISLDFYNKELTELKNSLGIKDEFTEVKDKLIDLALFFDKGVISIDEYSQAFRDLLGITKEFNLTTQQMKSATTQQGYNAITGQFASFGLGKIAGSTAIQQTTNSLKNLKKDGDDTLSYLEQAVRGFGNNFAQVFEQAVLTGKLSFKDLAKSILADLARIVLQLTVIRPISNAFSGVLSGLVSGIFAGATASAGATGVSAGGGAVKFIAKKFGGYRANGGPVMPSKAYMVGEQGPEMFVPKSAGSIIPNRALVSGNSQGGVTIVMNNHWQVASETVKAEVMKQTPAIANACKAAVSAEIARGGTLSRQVGARR